MNNDLVSVVIPIYKVEKYLHRCVDSVLKQTYKNIEVILVDDGSPDYCGKICDEYASKDKRIKVLHKDNGGLSDARNQGTKIARGKYITYIDSDDFVESDYIEYLYNLLIDNSCDMSIILPHKFYDNNLVTIKNKKEKIKIYNSEEALKVMLYQKNFDNAAWGKLYLLNNIKDIEFPVGKLYEDIGTTYKYILRSNKIAYSNQKKYYYLQRKDSIMGSPFSQKEMDYVYQSEIMMNDIKLLNKKKLIKAVKCRYLNANFSVILKIGKTQEYKKEKKELKNNIKKMRKEVLFDINSRIKTKAAIILSYLGGF